MSSSEHSSEAALLPTADQAREAASRRIKQRIEREAAEWRRREDRYRRRVEAQKEWLTATKAGRRKLARLVNELTSVTEDEYVKVTGSRAFTDALRSLLRDRGYECIHYRLRRRLRWVLEVYVWE